MRPIDVESVGLMAPLGEAMNRGHGIGPVFLGGPRRVPHVVLAVAFDPSLGGGKKILAAESRSSASATTSRPAPTPTPTSSWSTAGRGSSPRAGNRGSRASRCSGRPVQAGSAGYRVEEAGQVARAHVRLAGQVLHGQRLVQPPHHPGEQLGEGMAVLGGHRCGDELGLATGPVGRHDQAPGDHVGDRRAVVAADQMQA